MPQRESASTPRACLRLLGGWQLVVDGSDAAAEPPGAAADRLPGTERRAGAAARRRSAVARQHRRARAREPAPGSDADPARSSGPVARRPRLRRAGPGDRGRRGGGPSRRRGVRAAGVTRRAGRACSRCSAVRSCCPAGTTTGSSPSARVWRSCACVPSTGSRGRRWTGATWCSPSRPPGAATDIEPHSEAACEVALRAHLARGDLGGAVAEFRRYREATWDNVGVAPSDRIVALVESAFGADVDDASPVPVESPPAPVPPATGAAAAPRTPPPSRYAPGPARLPALPPRPSDSGSRRPPGVDGHARGHGHAGPRCGARTTRRPVATPASWRGWQVRRSCCWPSPSWWPSAAPSGRRADRRPARGRRRAGASGRLDGSPDGRGVLDRVGQQLSVQPAGVLPGVARFTLSATSLPASVQLTIRNASGPLVVRTLKVTSRDGRRVVLDGLPAGWSQWKATSPDVDPVSGRVWVPPPPSPSPTATPTPTAEAPPPRPSPTPQPGPTRTQPEPDPQPSPPPNPAPTPAQPAAKPTTQPSPTAQPTAQPQPTPTPAHSPARPDSPPTPARWRRLRWGEEADHDRDHQSRIAPPAAVRCSSLSCSSTAGLLTVDRAADATPVAASYAGEKAHRWTGYRIPRNGHADGGWMGGYQVGDTPVFVVTPTKRPNRKGYEPAHDVANLDASRGPSRPATARAAWVLSKYGGYRDAAPGRRRRRRRLSPPGGRSLADRPRARGGSDPALQRPGLGAQVRQDHAGPGSQVRGGLPGDGVGHQRRRGRHDRGDGDGHGRPRQARSRAPGDLQHARDRTGRRGDR